MPNYLIPENLIESLLKCPTPTTIERVSNLQKYIQELLGDTHYTFLQGSYKNDTAISDINDVDIVAVRRNTYSGSYSLYRCDQSILWHQIFSEIEQKLENQSKYDWIVTPGDKCIKIRGTFNADVVPAVQIGESCEEDPIAIYSFRSKKEKINYPRVHYENGVQKNKLTSGIYKPTVRMFKQWVKNHFGEQKNIISSFKIEALVHGMENEKFFDDYPTNFVIISKSILIKFNQRSLLPFAIPSVCGKEDITADWDITGRNVFLNKIRESSDLAYAAYLANTSSSAEDNWKKAFNL